MGAGLSTVAQTASTNWSKSSGEVISGRSSNHSPIGSTSLQKMLMIIAEVANDLFKDIMSVAMVMSTGEGIRGIEQLADMGIEIGGENIEDFMNSAEYEATMGPIAELLATYAGDPDVVVTWNESTGTLTIDCTGCDPAGVSHEYDLSENEYFAISASNLGDVDTEGNATCSLEDITIKLMDSEDILQNPGTLFYIQQVLQQMKDSLSAVTAVGKTGGDAVSAQMQTFARDVAG